MNNHNQQTIDNMARLGYAYAANNADIPSFSNDIDLMAFNAGISNANIRLGLNVAQITAINCKRIEQRERASFKELQTVWGN